MSDLDLAIKWVPALVAFGAVGLWIVRGFWWTGTRTTRKVKAWRSREKIPRCCWRKMRRSTWAPYQHHCRICGATTHKFNKRNTPGRKDWIRPPKRIKWPRCCRQRMMLTDPGQAGMMLEGNKFWHHCTKCGKRRCYLGKDKNIVLVEKAGPSREWLDTRKAAAV